MREPRKLVRLMMPRRFGLRCRSIVLAAGGSAPTEFAPAPPRWGHRFTPPSRFFLSVMLSCRLEEGKSCNTGSIGAEFSQGGCSIGHYERLIAAAGQQ